MKRSFHLFALVVITLMFAGSNALSGAVERAARGTVTPVELDHGEELRFTLRNGETRVLRLEDSGADILLSNVYPAALRSERIDHGILYQIWIDVTVDGHPMRLTRYLSSQASFNEPYAVNGMRVWLDYIRAPVGVFMADGRGGIPRKDARIVVNDLTDRICPDELVPWYRESAAAQAKEYANLRIDARDTYKGDDMHMGGYWGATPHRGLDINMRAGTRMIAPIDFDDHFIFSDTHRWRGVRDWGDGSVWWLQSHHLVRMVVPERGPLARGTYYADGAGTAVGEAQHSHFEFTIVEGGLQYWVDAWMLFWQTFRDLEDAAGAILAEIGPLSPAEAGTPVSFSSAGSRPGEGDALRYSWSFGDGGGSTEANPFHTYLDPGIYAVRLTVDDGHKTADFVQNITVDGTTVEEPGLTLVASGEVEFLPWPVNATRVHGERPAFLPHTLRFSARASRPVPAVKRVGLANRGSGTLPPAAVTVTHKDGAGWCTAESAGEGNAQSVSVSVDATGLAPGVYAAKVEVHCDGTVNARQTFRVRLQVDDGAPPDYEIIVKNTDEGFYATPWFWVPHSFHVNHTDNLWGEAGRWDRPKLPPALLTPEGKNRMGLTGLSLTNGHRAESGQFFRFTPDLAAGEYQISTPGETPWDATTEVDVLVRHAEGETVVRYRPGEDTVIGTFAFEEGRDGYVEFYAEGSVGQVSADAVVFLNADYVVKLTVDNADNEATAVGEWIPSTAQSGYFGEDYVHDGNEGKGAKRFRFTPRIVSGEHEVWLHWPQGPDHATSVPVTILTATGEVEVRVNQRDQGGDWYYIGSYALSGDEMWVEVRTGGTDGRVVADAVRLVPMDEVEDPSGLIAQWLFNDYPGSGVRTTAVDTVSSREMTLHNVAGDEGTWIEGKVGSYALKFDGVDDYATVGTVGLPPTHPRTIAAWVRLDAVQQPNWGLVFGFVGSNGATSFLVGFPSPGNRVIVDIKNHSWNLMTDMNTNWNHMAVTWDGSRIVGFLNGQSAFSVDSPAHMAVDDNFRLARIWNNFNGAVDDVRIYDRALTAEELRAIHEYQPEVPVTLAARGTPHPWLEAHGLVEGTVSHDDAEEIDHDGDGFAAWQEFVAGTDPTSPTSFFRIRSIELVDGGVLLRWDGVEGRAYRVYHCSSLHGTDWEPVSGTLRALSTDEMIFFHESGHGTENRFYSIRVDLW